MAHIKRGISKKDLGENHSDFAQGREVFCVRKVKISWEVKSWPCFAPRNSVGCRKVLWVLEKFGLWFSVCLCSHRWNGPFENSGLLSRQVLTALSSERGTVGLCHLWNHFPKPYPPLLLLKLSVIMSFPGQTISSSYSCIHLLLHPNWGHASLTPC